MVDIYALKVFLIVKIERGFEKHLNFIHRVAYIFIKIALLGLLYFNVPQNSKICDKRTIFSSEEKKCTILKPKYSGNSFRKKHFTYFLLINYLFREA